LWLDVDSALSKTFPHALVGELPVHATCIDSGYQTEAVTRFCEQRRGRRIWAVKGTDGPYPVWPRRISKAKKGMVYLIGVDAAKATFYDRLTYESGPGSIHWPATVGQDFFLEINSEYLQTEYHRGKPVRHWRRRKDNGTPRAAEKLDCAIYAYAGMCGLRQVAGIHLEAEAEKISLIRNSFKFRPPTGRPMQPRVMGRMSL
jgi:phage terminase large subunit GpA-like protein